MRRTFLHAVERRASLSSKQKPHPKLQRHFSQQPLSRNDKENINPNSPNPGGDGEPKSESWRRQKTEYKDNVTAALSLPVSDAFIDANVKDPEALLAVSADLIKEHAARRVDLFFYTLVSYYQSNLSVVRGKTEFQHGRGRNSRDNVNVTQACHSSFFGTLTDSSKGPIVFNALANGPSILSGTAFLNSLNSTIELPAFINQFDDLIEREYFGRVKSLSIIQNVSRGVLTPALGMTEFLRTMKQIFSDMDSYSHSISLSPDLSVQTKEITARICKRVLQLEREGTLINKWNDVDQAVNSNYIEMLLRLTPDQKAQCERSQEERSKVFTIRYRDIRNEILANKAVEKDNERNGLVLGG